MAADPYMFATLGQSDIALLDMSGTRRSDLAPEGLYAVRRGDEAVLRCIRSGAHGYYLVTDANMDNPNQWEQVQAPARDFPESVKARVRWLGREQDHGLPMCQRGRFLFKPISS